MLRIVRRIQWLLNGKWNILLSGIGRQSYGSWTSHERGPITAVAEENSRNAELRVFEQPVDEEKMNVTDVF